MRKGYSSLYNDLIPKLNQHHFKEQLLREVSNLFQWKGLEKVINYSLLERKLVTEGQLILIKHDSLGLLILEATLTGEDMYGRPTRATVNKRDDITFINNEYTIYYEDTYIEKDNRQYCVLINNMMYGESVYDLVNFYSLRLGMIWTSIDINLMWQNLPPIYSAPDSDVKLSLEKMVDDIWTGKPFIVTDKALFNEGQIQVGLAEVPFLFNELHKAHEQILSDFRSVIGINTSGTMKESGIGIEEITSNSQSIQNCLQVMLASRQQAVQDIKKLFNLDISVKVVGESKEEENNGNRNDRITESIEDKGI